MISRISSSINCCRTVPSLTASEFRNRLCDSDDHFIRFTGIDFVCPTSRRGILGKVIIDQFDHHAMKTGSLLVILLFGHERLSLRHKCKEPTGILP